MAGTTVADENAVSSAFIKAFEQFGFDVTEQEVRPLMGYRKTMAISLVLESKGTNADQQLVDSIHDAFVNEMLDYYEYSPEVRAMPTAENVFLQLKERGVRIALNTGFSREIADTIMTRLQWKERGLVDDFIASTDVEQGRPYPFMIRELMSRAGIIDPLEVAKIGDTEVDVNEGRNAGCALVIAVTTGAFTREQLADYHPDHILDHLSQLPELIFERG